MRFIVQRESLLKLLQHVIVSAERRQTMPILSNILLAIDDGHLFITGSDLEVEVTANVMLDKEHSFVSGSVTVPGRKLLDICRVLPDGVIIDFYQEGQGRVIVRSGHSRFALSTLPASDFPKIDWTSENVVSEFKLPRCKLRHLIASTQFAMAQQDVRHYLNGMLLEVKDGLVLAVAADGYRLAMGGIMLPVTNNNYVRIIMPRKGAIELSRLVDDVDDEVLIVFGSNHIMIRSDEFVFISKLIDSKFPEYENAIPRDGDKKIVIDKDLFKSALARMAVLSSDILRGVNMNIKSGLLKMYARSADREEAEDELPIEYQGDDLVIGFNVSYLMDALAAIDSDKVAMTLKDGASSALLEGVGADGNNLYVIMPLRL